MVVNMSLAQMFTILYRPIISSCSSNLELTHLIHIDNCSLFDESVHSSHIMLKYVGDDMLSVMLLRCEIAMTFKDFILNVMGYIFVSLSFCPAFNPGIFILM